VKNLTFDGRAIAENAIAENIIANWRKGNMTNSTGVVKPDAIRIDRLHYFG
jgi:hypothetical protein